MVNGFDTGQYQESYSEPVMARARISSVAGESEVEMFGASVQYDRIISSVQNLPIDEYSRLWIDSDPVSGEEYDYKVKRAARGLNHHLWAIEKVSMDCEKSLNNVFYGSAPAPGTIDGAFLRSLTTALSWSRKRTITVDAGKDSFVWYAVPVRLGMCTFLVGGFEGGFVLADTIDVINESGRPEPYFVYRSKNTALGLTKVIIT